MAFVYRGERVDLGFGRGWMDRPAAASIRRIDTQIGHPLQITEAGRDWAQQNKHYQHYLRYGSPIALSPDTPSLHQKGNAADSNEAQRIHGIMEDHGWRRTVYRWVNGKWTLVEPWHYEYFPQYDNHRNDPTPAAPESKPTPAPKRKKPKMNAAWRHPSNGTLLVQPLAGGLTTEVPDMTDWEGMVANDVAAASPKSAGEYDGVKNRYGYLPYPFFDNGRDRVRIVAQDGTTSRYIAVGGRAKAIQSTVELAMYQRVGLPVEVLPKADVDQLLIWEQF